MNYENFSYITEPSDVKTNAEIAACFLNASDIYVFSEAKGAANISIYRADTGRWATLSFNIGVTDADGRPLSPGCVLAALWGAAAADEPTRSRCIADSGLPAAVAANPTEAADTDKHHAIARTTYLSTADLHAITARALAGEIPAGELIVTEATAVAVGQCAMLPKLDLEQKQIPEFDVATPPSPTLPAKSASPEPMEMPEPAAPRTLQEIEDELDDNADGRPFTPPRRPSRARNIIGFSVLALLALAVGWLAVYYLPTIIPDSTPYDGMNSEDVTELAEISADTLTAVVPAEADSMVVTTDSVAAVTVADTVSAPVTAQPETEAKPAAVDANYAADLEYLNSTTRWRRDRLKSDAGRALFDSFAAADITAIVSQPYFAAKGECTNRTADRLATMLWRAHRTGTESANRQQLRKLKGKDEIDIAALFDRLSRLQDPKPNKTPRPSI